jgi:squalene cyclase
VQAAIKVAALCKEILADRQSLHDGGWPFTAAQGRPALEPTCLALLALRSDKGPVQERAIRFLLEAQNPNGSWPAFVGDDTQGCGLTGLALLALQCCRIRGQATERAIRWLLNLRGWESHWLWKWKFRTTDRHVRFDPDKFGWPWTPEAVSWVVPTSYSLLALKRLPAPSPADLLRFRIQRGVEMLFDRACPNGGWNAGNGVVYGEPMTPHLDATALALLALRSEPANELVAASLDWLRRRSQTCFAPWSLSWAVLALDAYGLPTGLLLRRLTDICEPDQTQDCATLAVSALALDCADGHNTFQETT